MKMTKFRLRAPAMARLACLSATAAMLAGGAYAAPLTFDAALKSAGEDAPSLHAKVVDVEAARSSAIAAGRLPDPKLGFGVEGFPVSGPNAGRPNRDDFSDARVSLMQDVPSGAKRRAARERADADIGAAQASQFVEGRNVRLGAALAWIDLYYAERRLAALDEVDQALTPMRKTAPSQVVSGASRPAQTLEPQQLTAVLADRRADLVVSVAKARAELGRWTGDPAAEASGDPPALSVDPVALRAGLDRHPSLLAYDAIGRQAGADVDAAKAEKHPDWSWEVGYQHRDPRFGDMALVGATVSLPLFAGTRQDPIIAARADVVNRVRFEREATRRALAASLDGDLADHLMHHERLARAEETLVPLAKRRAELETASYAAGTAGLSDVLQAYLALAEARIDALNREADVERDAVRINLTYEAADQ
jgi:cobalt-zinc-cadmium efflux system outer membrane protein